MADGTNDPFDFPDDPLAGVDDLDIPSFGAPDERPAIPPPLHRSAFLPPEGSPPSDAFPPREEFQPRDAFPPREEFPPPQYTPNPPAEPSPQDFPPQEFAPP